MKANPYLHIDAKKILVINRKDLISFEHFQITQIITI